MDKLTLVAALPGSGAGYMSALAPELAEQPKVQMKAPYFALQDLEWPPIVFLDEEPEA